MVVAWTACTKTPYQQHADSAAKKLRSNPGLLCVCVRSDLQMRPETVFLAQRGGLKRLADFPAMPERIENRAVPPSVVAILHGGADLRAGSDYPVEDSIRVLNDKHESNRSTAELCGRRIGAKVAGWMQPELGAVNQQLRDHVLSRRRAPARPRPKCLLIESNRLANVPGNMKHCGKAVAHVATRLRRFPVAHKFPFRCLNSGARTGVPSSWACVELILSEGDKMATKRTSEQAEVTLEDSRWPALLSRDRTADGTFFYSVASTGVYCRPSCGARTPRPENVTFYGTAEQAEAAGYRACKRCKPNELSPASEMAAKMATACRAIERSESAPSLQTLAKEAGMSRFHFHRTFKAIMGVTPAQYASAQRTTRVRESLERSKTVTEAIYDAGYNSSSRFYESADRALGMRPTEFRDGGAKARIFFAVGQCSMGNILVAQTERGVCAILIGDDAEQLLRDLQDRFPKATLVGDASEYQELVAKVVGLVEDPSSGFGLPLDIRGTAFQQRVWNALQQIPAGTTATYAEIAAKIGMPKATRAVAQACGANSLAVAIPCHRVIRNDGSLSGYRWGIERKRTLLEREQRI